MGQNNKAVSAVRTSRKKDELEQAIKSQAPKEKPQQELSEDPVTGWAAKRKRLDPLTEQLGQTHYEYKKRFEWLKREMYGRLKPMEVDRYYEGLKLCVDLMLDKDEQENIPLKKQLCEKNGMQYFHVSSPQEIEDMLVRIEKQ